MKQSFYLRKPKGNKETLILFSCYFKNEQNGFLAKGNEIWKTIDGGESWSKADFLQEAIPLRPFQINGFASLSPTQIIAIGQLQETEKTYAEDLYFLSTNGGADWQLLAMPFQQESSPTGLSAWSVVDNQLFIDLTVRVLLI